MHVFVMRGCPGSGKSTLAEALFHAYAKVGQDGKLDGAIVSADEYFTRRAPGGEITGYFHDQNLEPEAHNACFRSYWSAVTNSVDCIIVDNTSSRLIEAAGYFQLGSSLGYTVVLYTVHALLEVCLERNVHGVPDEVINAMWERIDGENREEPPPWWLTDEADQDFVEMFYSEVMGRKPGLPPSDGKSE
jgi:predicted kinase